MQNFFINNDKDVFFKRLCLFCLFCLFFSGCFFNKPELVLIKGEKKDYFNSSLTKKISFYGVRTQKKEVLTVSHSFFDHNYNYYCLYNNKKIKIKKIPKITSNKDKIIKITCDFEDFKQKKIKTSKKIDDKLYFYWQNKFYDLNLISKKDNSFLCPKEVLKPLSGLPIYNQNKDLVALISGKSLVEKNLCYFIKF
jgi:hypothetical protein